MYRLGDTMNRKKEWFIDIDYGAPVGTVMSTITEVFPQERDWTCSVACIRTLLSSVGVKEDEDYFINNLNIIKGPQNSRDIKNWGLIYKDDSIIYGCDKPVSDDLAGDLTKLLQTHNVMVECMLNYAHWLVILSYIQLGSLEDDIIIFYDPYFNEVRQIRADEFFSMWWDIGDKPLHRDYVAIRKGC